jgi:hypothetical protein
MNNFASTHSEEITEVNNVKITVESIINEDVVNEEYNEVAQEVR